MKISSELDPLLEEHGNAVIGGLWLAPEIAKQLGIYLATVTQYEMALIPLYGFSAGVSGAMASATLGELINISMRLDRIKHCLKERKAEIDLENGQKAKSLLKAAYAINKRRNELVHGTYKVYEKTGLVVITTWIFSANKLSKAEYITAKDLENNIQDIRKFCGTAFEIVGII